MSFAATKIDPEAVMLFTKKMYFVAVATVAGFPKVKSADSTSNRKSIHSRKFAANGLIETSPEVEIFEIEFATVSTQ
jgi:hypothetical protein